MGLVFGLLLGLPLELKYGGFCIGLTNELTFGFNNGATMKAIIGVALDSSMLSIGFSTGLTI